VGHSKGSPEKKVHILKEQKDLKSMTKYYISKTLPTPVGGGVANDGYSNSEVES
jgi:hypothetical protein